jgi:hypothetical protein
MVLAAPGVHGGSFNSTSPSRVARAHHSPPEWHRRGASRRRWRIQTVVAQGKGPLAAAAWDSPMGGGGLEKEGEADL